MKVVIRKLTSTVATWHTCDFYCRLILFCAAFALQTDSELLPWPEDPSH